jgi:hypothetical protein
MKNQSPINPGDPLLVEKGADELYELAAKIMAAAMSWNGRCQNSRSSTNAGVGNEIWF